MFSWLKDDYCNGFGGWLTHGSSCLLFDDIGYRKELRSQGYDL